MVDCRWVGRRKAVAGWRRRFAADPLHAADSGVLQLHRLAIAPLRQRSVGGGGGQVAGGGGVVGGGGVREEEKELVKLEEKGKVEGKGYGYIFYFEFLVFVFVTDFSITNSASKLVANLIFATDL